VSAADPVALGLPHREPFIFVDAVVEHTPGEAAACRKIFLPGGAILPRPLPW
jgi:3-hydroxyacyl-[acyl-carrier-protein] dehydratase